MIQRISGLAIYRAIEPPVEGRARQPFETLNKEPRWREDRRNDRSPPGRTGVSLECPAEGIHLLTSGNFTSGAGLEPE